MKAHSLTHSDDLRVVAKYPQEGLSMSGISSRLRFGLAAWILLVCGPVPRLTGSESSAPLPTSAQTQATEFPLGTATPSEECGACHQAIYKEFAFGFGADLKFQGMVYRSGREARLVLPTNVAPGSTAHSAAGVDPFPIHARDVEEQGRSCNVCHYPQPFAIPSIDTPEIAKPQARPKDQEVTGLTCASCHLTPDGKIRGPHEAEAPHSTVADPSMRTAAMCAYCHGAGKRVVGKQTQTFLEWREDFSKPGLGRQECQDCHMPRTVRKTAENFDVPARAVARHLWTGGHSAQRMGNSLSLVLVQPWKKQSGFELHVINIGAGHSVPTGSSRRGIYLKADVADSKGEMLATREWLFAPWYGNRPDDRAYLDEDKKRPDAVAAMQADSQGPHEPPIRAGDERVLTWAPPLKFGTYTFRARLVFDLNRYNDPSFIEDQTAIAERMLSFDVGDKPEK